MINCVLYDKRTGKITKRIFCDDEYIDSQLDQDSGVHYDCPEHATHIIDGVPSEIIEDSYFELMKKVKKDEINYSRVLSEKSPFEFRGKLFDADDKAIKRLTVATLAAQSAIVTGNTFTITWTCADNTTIELTERDILDLLATMTLRGVQLHERAKALKAQVDEATTIEEVNSISW